MHKEQKVSILTPCYNSQDYLERYFKCILAQKYNNIELIIINDGSTDLTENIVCKYKEDFLKRGYELVYIKQDNKGLGGAINTGLKRITGEFFTWCDSDNLLTEDYITTKIDFFNENPKYSIVRCDGYIVDEKDLKKPIGKMSDGNNDKYNENLFEYCLFEKNFHFGCAMIKTSDFDKVNPERNIYPSRHGQNWQLLLPMFYNYKSGYIDKPMFTFVYREKSVSNCVAHQALEKRYEQQEEYCKIILETLKTMEVEEKNDLIKKIQIKYSMRCFEIAINAGDKERARKEYIYQKKLGSANFRSKFNYLRSKFACINLMYKVIRKLKNSIKKLMKKNISNKG